MVETVDDIVLKTREKADQMRVRRTPTKVIKKLINVFIAKN